MLYQRINYCQIMLYIDRQSFLLSGQVMCKELFQTSFLYRTYYILSKKEQQNIPV